MPLIEYIPTNFHPGSRFIIDEANKIINDWAGKGYYGLTLRQIYYRFIALDLFPTSWIDTDYNKKHGLHPSTKNTLRNYKKLGDILNAARLGGKIDWDAMEDVTRRLKSLQYWESVGEAQDWLEDQYKHNKWKDQPTRVEVWVEKDALLSIFEKICTDADISTPLFSCRGYSSQSSMWGAAQRMLYYEELGQQTAILQFSDHDPSGIDMTRDIRDRLTLFRCSAKVYRLALNIAQVNRFNLPPNPAKETDIRFSKYAEQFGADSWELDALEPNVIADLVRRAVVKIRNRELWDAAIKHESGEVLRIKAFGKPATGITVRGKTITFLPQ